MVKTIFPERLPCDATKPFVVTLDEPLPAGADDFTLVFKGKRTKKRSQGTASRLDARTLLAKTGLHDEAEEVTVTTTAVGKSFRVDPFKLCFAHAYRMICELLPDSATVHAAAAIAQCLPDDFIGSRVLDEELEDLCDRLAVPSDLTMMDYFGASCRWTLLHFAAKRNLPKFAAQLLVRSSGATAALQATDDAGATPFGIALELWKGEEICQVFEDYEAAEGLGVNENVSNGKENPRSLSKKRSALDIAAEKQQKKGAKGKTFLKRLTGLGLTRKSSSSDKKRLSEAETPDKEKSISSFKGELETRFQPYGSMGGARDRPLPLPPSADPKSKPPPPSEPRPPASPPEDDDDDEEFDEPIQSRSEINKKKPIGKAYANANFSPSVTDPSDAISFKSGDIFNVVAEMSGEWLLAVDLGGALGRIPQNFVTLKRLEDICSDEDEGGGIYEVVDQLQKDGDADSDGGIPDYYNATDLANDVLDGDAYVAIYEFVAQNEEQLTIYVGDRLRVLETSDSGWWGAQLIGNNKRGLVPNNYIEKEKEKPSAETSSKLSGGSSSVPGSSHSSGNSLAPPMASRSSGSATLPRRPPKGSTSTITKSDSIDSGKSSGGIAKMLSGFEHAASAAAAAAASSSLPSSVPRSSGTLPSLRREKEEEKSPVPNPIYGRGGVKAKSKTLDSRSGTAPPEVVGGGGGGGGGGASFSAIKAKLEGKSPSSAPTTPLMKRKAPAPKEPTVITASSSSAGATSPPPISIGAVKAKLEASATSAAPFSDPVKKKAFGGDAGKAGNRSEAKPSSIADSPIFKKRQKEADANAGASAAPPPPPTKPSKQPPKQPPKVRWKVLYDYNDTDSDFAVKGGDIITDVDNEHSTDEWILARVGSQQGFIPRSYVKKIP